MFDPKITIITPTTGKDSLFRLIESIEDNGIPYVHILLWDDKRDDQFLFPDSNSLIIKQPRDLDFSSELGNRYSIVIPGSMVQGSAAGSSLRAIGLMSAKTPYVVFADDDVWYEKNHLQLLLDLVKDKNWAYCKRKIWADENDYIGIDDFESVGDSISRKVPYEMVDNNCMIFDRRFGTSGAVIYRETKDYNDDRLFYAFLKEHGGIPGKSNTATINQVCPKRLEPMFRQFCIK